MGVTLLAQLIHFSVFVWLGLLEFGAGGESGVESLGEFFCVPTQLQCLGGSEVQH